MNSAGPVGVCFALRRSVPAQTAAPWLIPFLVTVTRERAVPAHRAPLAGLARSTYDAGGFPEERQRLLCLCQEEPGRDGRPEIRRHARELAALLVPGGHAG